MGDFNVRSTDGFDETVELNCYAVDCDADGLSVENVEVSVFWR